MVAEQNAAEAALVRGVRVIAACSLTAAADWLRGTPVCNDSQAAQEYEGGHEFPDGRVRGARGSVSGTVSNSSAVSDGHTCRVAVPDAATVPDLPELLGQSTARRAPDGGPAGGHHPPPAGPAPAGAHGRGGRVAP